MLSRRSPRHSRDSLGYRFARDSHTRSPSVLSAIASAIATSFGLSHVRRLVLRLTGAAHEEMRPDRLVPPSTFSTTSTRVSSASHSVALPCLRDPRRHEDRAFHDARSAEADLRRISYVGGVLLLVAAFFGRRHAAEDRASDVSVASSCSPIRDDLPDRTREAAETAFTARA